MVYCSVACCKNGNHNRPELAYFTFPSDKRLGAWLNFCRRADKKFAEERSKAKARKANNLRICSAHFAPEAYKKTLNGKRIPYDTALPTIFQPNIRKTIREEVFCTKQLRGKGSISFVTRITQGTLITKNGNWNGDAETAGRLG